MKRVTSAEISSCEEALLLSLDDEQREILVTQCQDLQDIFADLKERGHHKEEPMFFPFEIEQEGLREDVVGTPLSNEEVLLNAPRTKDGQIEVPKVVR